MEKLKNMKETLVSQVMSQMGNIQQVDTKELGEAIDMIKDLSEAVYYCSIVEAMDNKNKERPIYYYTTPSPSYNYNRREYGDRMLYDNRNFEMRDEREGRSPINRRYYMESKEMHMDKTKQMHELEKYMQELTTDMVEMIKDASPEEKQMLFNKLQNLSQRIENI